MLRTLLIALVLFCVACSGSQPGGSSSSGGAAASSGGHGGASSSSSGGVAGSSGGLGTSAAATAGGSTGPRASTSTGGSTGASGAGSTGGSSAGNGASSSTGGSGAAASGGSSGSGSGNSIGGSGNSTGGPGGSTGGPGGSTGSGGSSGATVPTPANYASLYVAAFCNFENGCEQNAAYAQSYEATQCTQQVAPMWTGLAAAADAGRIVFDATAATECLAAFVDGGCFYPAPCLEAVTGNVPGGGACYAGGGDCAVSASTNNGSCSCTCAQTVGLGQNCSCSGQGSCIVCDKGLLCENGTCQRAVGLGGACTGASPSSNCAAGLDCINGSCAQIPVGIGRPCHAGDCQGGSYCLVPVGANSGTCTAQVGLGHACGEDAAHAPNASYFVDDRECAGNDVTCLGAGQATDGSQIPGVCTVISDLGGPCTPAGANVNVYSTYGYNDGCAAFLVCPSGSCVKAPSAGSPCYVADPNYPCDLTTSYCDTTQATSTCEPFVSLGGSCYLLDQDVCGGPGSANQCVPGSGTNGTCQDPQPCDPWY
ncbi:MAG: hypothetical protein ACYDCL_13285 [Myxococcales bacterium]